MKLKAFQVYCALTKQFPVSFHTKIQYNQILKSICEKLGIAKPPVKPLTPFAKFTVDYYHTDGVHREVNGSNIGAKWRALSNEEKAKYYDEYKKHRQLYDDQIRKYDESLTEEQKNAIFLLSVEILLKQEKMRLNKALKETAYSLQKPKKPMNAIMLLVTERKYCMRKSSDAQDLWNSLSVQEQAAYTDKFNRLREKYHEDMRSWETKMIQEGNLDLIRKSTRSKVDRLLVNGHLPSRRGSHLHDVQ